MRGFGAGERSQADRHEESEMNPDTNRFEALRTDTQAPEGWIEFAIGEEVHVKNYRFKIIKVSANRLHLEPVGKLLTATNAKSVER